MNTVIGVSNLLTSASITASAETTGSEAIYVYETDITDQWKPGAAPATLVIDNGVATAASYLGVTHEGVSSVTLEGSADDITYDPITVVSNPARVSMTQFTEVSYRYYRLTFAGVSTMALLHVGLGVEVKIEGYLVTPFIPFSLAGEHEMIGATTRAALPLGRSTKLVDYPWTMNFQMIQPDWAMGAWLTLYNLMVESAFYVLWDSVNYPADALFAQLSQFAKPEYSSTVDMSLTLQGSGYR